MNFITIIFLLTLFQFSTVGCNAQVPGCTDPLANNYNSQATDNDGSCTYDPISVSPKSTFSLSDQLMEISGLIIWDGNLWAHNDNRDVSLYGLDFTTADIVRTYLLNGVENNEWEEISQDKDFIYLGDFGNNVSGNRADLHILRVEKSSLLAGNPQIDTIWFTYIDQLNLDPVGPNETDFDCEAFIVSDSGIFLFTKQWTSVQTGVYALPKLPGRYTAEKLYTYDAEGLITGASYFESGHLLVLCGYTGLVHPFLVLLYDYNNNDFISGNKRRVTVSLPFHQIEGIASSNGLTYYISNESLVFQPLFNNPQKLHIFKLNELLEDYLNRTGLEESVPTGENGLLVLPNPSQDRIYIKAETNMLDANFQIVNQLGVLLLSGKLTEELTEIDISYFSGGIYFFKTMNNPNMTFRFVKI